MKINISNSFPLFFRVFRYLTQKKIFINAFKLDNIKGDNKINLGIFHLQIFIFKSSAKDILIKKSKKINHN